MTFLQSRIAEWFSRGLNNGTNLMHSCESTSLCLFKMKTHINVCTDHRCANFFLSHVKPLCSLTKISSLKGDPGWPRYPKVANTPGWTLTPAEDLATSRWHTQGRQRQTGFAGCCCCWLLPQLLWKAQRFQLCNLQWFGVNLCSFSSCQDTVALSPSPMSQQHGMAQLLKKNPTWLQADYFDSTLAEESWLGLE